MVAFAYALPVEPLVDEALGFAQRFLRAHEGETLVVGFRGGRPAAAFAAAAPSERHKAHLTMLARYLFARHGVDAYLVASQVSRDGLDWVALESTAAGSRHQYFALMSRTAENPIGSLGAAQPQVAREPLLGDLLLRGQSLPGVIRRGLDQAYDLLRVDYPGGA